MEEEEEEDMEEEDKLDTMVEDRPPLATPATGPMPRPSPLPLLRFLADTGKGEVEAGLFDELCLLSGATILTKLELKHDS